MPFATTEDIGARLGRTLTPGEETTVELLLEGATAALSTAAGIALDGIDPKPPILRFLSIEVVCRAMANPNSLEALNEQLGSYQYGARFRAEAGLLLTRDERAQVRKAVNGTSYRSVTLETPYSGDDVEDDLELPLDP